MKIERTKNATRNMFFGWGLTIYNMIMSFVMRTVMIYFLGPQYLGLNSLFTSVLSTLSLVELGVGSAMVYSMYKPIAEDDTVRICALLKLYRIYYRIIGLVIGLLGIILLPFIHQLIHGDIPKGVNIYILYLVNLASTVLSYWLYSYKNSLLSAHQRGDVGSKIMMFASTLTYAIQIIMLILTKNYYVYVCVALVMQCLVNLITALIVSKMYPCYKPVGRLERGTVRQINQRIRDLFTAKVGTIVVNSVDTIVISSFLGLTMLAIYQNYFYILASVKGIIGVIFSSVTAGIGNSLIVESKKKNLCDLRKFTFIIAWITGICTCCFLCLYQPFMKIWVGEELMLEFPAVICFCLYFFIVEINQLLNLYKDAGGLWHQDRFRPMVTALANLIMNLIMVQLWGIYGILLSTILSMLVVGMPWLLYNIFTVLFDKKELRSYLELLVKCFVVSCIACILTLGICSCLRFATWLTLAVRLFFCAVIPNIIFFLVYRKTDEFVEALRLVNVITNGKLSFIKIFLREE